MPTELIQDHALRPLMQAWKQTPNGSRSQRMNGSGGEGQSEALLVPIPGKAGAGQPALRPGRPVSARPAPGPASPPTSS